MREEIPTTKTECHQRSEPPKIFMADVPLKKKQTSKQISPAPKNPQSEWQNFTQGLFNSRMALKPFIGFLFLLLLGLLPLLGDLGSKTPGTMMQIPMKNL